MPSAIALAIAKRVMACNILRIWIRGNLGHHVFLAQISATRKDGRPEGKQVKDIPIVQDFPKVFSEKLPGLPPARPIDCLVAIAIQLNNLGREIKKLTEKVHAIHVSCELCYGPYLSKDFPKKEDVKSMKEAYCGEFFGRPYPGPGRYRAGAPENFMAESTKRHEGTEVLIMEIPASTDVALRNQGAFINTIETQVGEISKVTRVFSNDEEASMSTIARPSLLSATTVTAEPPADVLSVKGLLQLQLNSEPLDPFSGETIKFPKLDAIQEAITAETILPKMDKEVLAEVTHSRQELSGSISTAGGPNSTSPAPSSTPLGLSNSYTPTFDPETSKSGKQDDNGSDDVDLGASVSSMPYSTYAKLGIGELASTRLSIELVDKAVKCLRGIVEIVLGMKMVFQCDKLVCFSTAYVYYLDIVDALVDESVQDVDAQVNEELAEDMIDQTNFNATNDTEFSAISEDDLDYLEDYFVRSNLDEVMRYTIGPGEQPFTINTSEYEELPRSKGNVTGIIVGLNGFPDRKPVELDPALPDNHKKDAMALFFIQSALDDDIFPCIASANTSNQAWEILNAIYGSRLECHSRKTHSSLGVILREVYQLALKGFDFPSHCKIRIGDGLNTRFWLDTWTLDLSLCVQFPRLFALEFDKEISVAAKWGAPSFDDSFRRQVRDGVKRNQWYELLSLLGRMSLYPSSDRYFCDLNGDGVFRVKDIRSALDELFLPSSDVATRWVKFVPIKVNIFAWRVSLDCLLTRGNLISRGVIMDSPLCPICELTLEDSSHLFFSCDLGKMHLSENLLLVEHSIGGGLVVCRLVYMVRFYTPAV
uniref:RNA-directed DNA polymerase, eukaryota n=1 Tax=Tanacetum cinerariifolium TaxID=118510 RepID=A0A6L2KGV3_TANCI|nr:RNA-directed DNA polymerase, eukaryota [Tanacetum cinerariifolium]